MKTVQELFEMMTVMTSAKLHAIPFQYKGVPFTREEWIEWCEEQEGVRFCLHCGDLMTDGYLIGGSDTYCSLSCVGEAKAVSDEDMDSIKNDDDYDDDNFFYTEWVEDMEEC